MKFDMSKINWKKVATIGGCVFTGVLAFVGAIDEHKQAEKIEDMEKRISELEKDEE